MFTFDFGDVLGLISTISFRFCSDATWKQILRPQIHRISPRKTWQLLLELTEWVFLLLISMYIVEDGSAVCSDSENHKLTNWPVQFLESGTVGAKQPIPQKEGGKDNFSFIHTKYTHSTINMCFTVFLQQFIFIRYELGFFMCLKT